MNKLIILFPNQLFEYKYLKKIYNNKQDDEKINKNKYIILLEHNYFFKKYKYHKLKLSFHRATMQKYYDDLDKTFIKLYIENTVKDYSQEINNFIKKNNINKICFFNPIEKELINLVEENKLIKDNNIEILLFPTPYFLNSSSFDKNNNLEKTLSSIRHDIFYKTQRINYDVMIKKVNNKFEPIGGKWSFDTENRKPYEKNQHELQIKTYISKERKDYIKEAIEYVNKNYKDHYGSCLEENFIYPIDHKESEEWLDNFVKNKLENFGKYEDALSSKIKFGYHSLLSALNNCGLITSKDILEKIKKYNKNLASKEGFVRQIIGWREYCYFVYDKFYDKLIISSLYTKNKNKMPNKIWYGETKIPIIDNIIKNLEKYAYSHHIERLMCLGNFFLLLGINTDEIYKWFQTMYIDAYDVFMVPNVYGMLCYGMINDKIHMMTKPYICSSNYLIKMSDYKSSEIEINDKKYKWDEILDALYYNHIHNYQDVFVKFYSTSMMVTRWKKFDENKKKDLLSKAKFYINWINS